MEINSVAKFIKSKPYLLQIAKDEVWEKTWNINLSKTIPTKEEIKKYLRKNKYKNIAIEALFKNDDGIYILGLIFNKHLLTKHAEDFISIFIRESLTFQDFATYVNNLDKSFIGGKYLFTGDPDLIRVGIVNYWFSVGPCLIWQKGWGKKISRAKLEERLQKKPEVINTKLNYQGMSFVFNVNETLPGLCYWIKSPCSKNVGGAWILDREMILKYLDQWQEFEVK